jgi:hypothetical protein
MRLCCLITVTVLALLGCGGSTTPPAKPFEIAGTWTYLGPSDGPHDLMITDDSMVYTDIAGAWSSHWTIKAYDNDLHHFQVTFDSGSGTYLPVGQSMSGSYEVSGPLLTVQLGSGLASYPPLQNVGTCTAAADGTPTPECRLYIKPN